jgi:soluble lytic murein transglycosylase
MVLKIPPLRTMAGLCSGCGQIPVLLAAWMLLAARFFPVLGPPSVFASARPVIQPEVSGDCAAIEQVLSARAPDLGLTLRGQVAKSIAEEAAQASYDPFLILAIIDVESDFDEDAVSNKGARGLMQMKPRTLQFLAADQGLRLTEGEIAADPSLQVRLAVRYLRQLQNRLGGDLDLALMAYNAGPSRIRRAIKQQDLDPFRRYTRLVRRDFRRFREGLGLGGDWALAVRDSR